MEKNIELTEKQLFQIESYLTKKKFVFIDLKIEILDHIICDIESLLVKKYSYDNAFKIILLKWDKQFKETNSFYFGVMYYEASIVIKKAAKIFRPFFFLYLSAYFLPIIFLKNFSIMFPENIFVFFNSITVISLIYVVYIIIKILKSKLKTTYSFILKTQYLGIIFLIIPLFVGNNFEDQSSLNTVFIDFRSVGFAITYIFHYFFKKHKEVIKKYKIS